MTLGDKHIQIASTDERIQSSWGVISPYVHLNMLIYIVYSMCLEFAIENLHLAWCCSSCQTHLWVQPLELYANSDSVHCAPTHPQCSQWYICEIVTLCVYCVSNHTHVQTHTCAHTSSRARVQFRDSWCTRHKQIGRASFQCNRTIYWWRRGVRGVHAVYIFVVYASDKRRCSPKLCMPHDSRRVGRKSRPMGGLAKRHIFPAWLSYSILLYRLFRLGIVWRNDGRWMRDVRAANGTHYVIGLKRKMHTHDTGIYMHVVNSNQPYFDVVESNLSSLRTI